MKYNTRDKKSGKKRIILITSALLVISIILIVIGSDEINVLLLDSLLNNKGYIGYDPNKKDETEVVPPGHNPDGFNKYEDLANKLDMNKLPSSEEIVGDIPTEFYRGSNGKMNLKREIQQYTLMCEILRREEINPSDEDIKLQPYMLYGSWFAEQSLGPIDNEEMDIYKELTAVGGNANYVGPISLSAGFLSPYTWDKAGYSGRMYSYISNTENKEIDEDKRVLRIFHAERVDYSNKLPNIAVLRGVNNGQRPINTSPDISALNEYISEYNSDLILNNAWEYKIRPNPLYMPDAFYTFFKKLRDSYDGLDIYTLQTSTKYGNQTELVTKAHNEILKTYPEIGVESDMLSVLSYLRGVSLNSSQIAAHAFTEDVFKTSGEEFEGLMPRVYMEILAQYKSISPSALGINSYNTSSGNNGFKTLWGKTAKDIKNHSVAVSQKDNLIDKLWEEPKVFSKNEKSIRAQIEEAMDELSWELSQTLFYPLRCLASGIYIQNGVESAIQLAYEYQIKNKIIVENDNGDLEDTDSGVSGGSSQHRKSPGTTDGVQLVPNELLDVLTRVDFVHPICSYPNGSTTINHGYYCGSTNNKFDWEFCKPWHKSQHLALDMGYRADTGKVLRSQHILAAYGGEVTKIAWNPSSVGRAVYIQHELEDGTKFSTSYLHMVKDSVLVKVGDIVVAGQVLGIEGTTGNSSGEHLHFEIIKDKKKYDYEAIIEKSKKVICSLCKVEVE